MFKNTKALQAGANGILLSLVWYGLCFGAYLLANNPYQPGPSTFMPILTVGLSFVLAGISLAWSFSRGKPHIAYGGLHVFFALCCFGMAVLTQSVPVLFFPIGISLLLFILNQPILALLGDHRVAAPLKWTREEPPPYEAGYRPSSPEAVHQEGRQRASSPNPEQEQAQTLYPQTYQ